VQLKHRRIRRWDVLWAVFNMHVCVAAIFLSSHACVPCVVDLLHVYSTACIAVQPKHRRIRRWDVLWAVFNMGVRFMELYKRRMKRIEVYQRCAKESSSHLY
jgi:hypothetical protein